MANLSTLTPLLVVLAHLVLALNDGFADGGDGDNTTAKKLHLLSLLPYSDTFPAPLREDGPDILPAVEMAVDHVNERDDVLPCFVLDLVTDDGGCDITNKAYLSFVRQVLSEEPNIVGIVGPTCSASALAVSSLVRHEEIALISVHLGSSELIQNDEEENPYSFGILGSTLSLAHSALNLIEAVGWERIAVLYAPNIVFFHTLYVDFVTEKVKNNITLSLEVSAPVAVNEFPLSLIRDVKTRIIVTFLDPNLSRMILCLALRKGMVYPNYQWVWVAQSPSDFNQSVEFEYEGKDYSCAVEDLWMALDRNVLLNFRLAPNDPQHKTISGLSYDQFYDEYVARINTLNNASEQENTSLQTSPYAPVVYDAVWALALALNQSLDNVNLTGYKYGMPEISSVISDNLLMRSFEGVSGYITFKTESRFANRAIDIYLLKQQNHVVVNTENITDNNFLQDSFPEYYPEVTLLAIFIVLGIVIVELILVVITHFVTCCYHKERSIKAVSVTLNHFVYLGLYLFVVGIILYLLVKGVTLEKMVAGIVCHATWPWVLSIGFTLIIGTVTVRMWRIYRIFVHYRDPGRFISNQVLVLIILIMIIIDLVIAITWTIIDPIRATVISEEVTEADGTISIEIERTCISQNTFLWVGLVIGYKVITLLCMLTLAILTRKVRDKDFATQNNQVAAFILALSIVLGSIFYLLFYFSRVNVHIDFAILCFAFIVIIAVCYGSILLPPVVRLMRKKTRKLKEQEPVKRMSSMLLPPLQVVSSLIFFQEAPTKKPKR